MSHSHQRSIVDFIDDPPAAAPTRRHKANARQRRNRRAAKSHAIDLRCSAFCGLAGHPRMVLVAATPAELSRAERAYRCATCGRPDLALSGGHLFDGKGEDENR